MDTRQTLEQYFAELSGKGDWKRFLADDLSFTSFVAPPKEVSGRDAYIAATARFFGMVQDVEVRDMVIDDSKACALTRYRLAAPDGHSFASDVAEVFTVSNGLITSLGIYFDSRPFPG